MSGLGVASTFYLASVFAIDPHEPPLWLNPLVFSLLFAAIGALLFSYNLGSRRFSAESAIGVVYIVASALVIIVLASSRVTQEKHEIDDLLYGSAVAVPTQMVYVVGSVAAVTAIVHALFYKELLLVSFDRDMARTLGYRARAWDLLLFSTFALVVSVSMRAIGALPVFAFMVIPAAAALLFAKRLWSAFLLSIVFGATAASAGYYVSFAFALSTGASMALCTAAPLSAGLVWMFFRRR
jgi:zinc transport system permease protein